MNAIYARVSTDAQAEQGYSLEDQKRSCHAHAAKLGLPTTKESEYIDDGFSGEYLERPELDRLRDDLRAKLTQNVIVYDPDRLSRNLTNQLLIADDIERAGAKLYFVTGDYDASPEGRLFFSIRGAISAFEKAKIRERTMRGKRSKAISGKLVFDDDLYGYTYDKEKSMYIVKQDEAETVKLIFELYTSRGYGINSLHAELKAMGILNRKGNPFNSSTLHKMLSNETYAGTKWSFTTYDKTIGQKKRKKKLRDESEWIPIEVPPIISRECFEKAVECRKLNKVSAKRNTKNEYLLQNMIRCAGCGYALHGITYHRIGKEYPYYVCTAYINNNKCDCRRCIPANELDECVWNDMRKAAKSKRGLSNLNDKKSDNITAKKKLESQLTESRAKQAAILRWVNDGTVKIEIADKELQNINKEIASIQMAINTIVLPSSTGNNINLKDVLKAETFEEKRRCLLMSGLTVYAKREGKETVYSIRP